MSSFDYDLIVLVQSPIGPGNPLRQGARRVRALLQRKEVPSLGGHYGVTRSLRDGLEKTGTNLRWKFAERLGSDTSLVIHVLAGHDQLKQAITARSQGRCRRVLAGPNIVMWPDEDELLGQADTVIVPSQWVLDSYEVRQPGIGIKTKIWPAGVDETFWSPSSATQRHDITLYNKGRNDETKDIGQLLTGAGYRVHVVSYGSYTTPQYRAALDKSFVCIVVGRSESQGLAIAEAWAMDVPTLVARFDVLFDHITCSAAPYMSDATGLFWDHQSELVDLIQPARGMKPRDWLLAHQTDQRASKQLLSLAGLR